MTIETEKNTCSVEPFTLDWSGVYQQLEIPEAGNPITASDWVGVDVTVDGSVYTGLLATAIVSGGVADVPATLKNTITIASLGYTFCQKFNITILD
jgi:hypothetical protein